MVTLISRAMTQSIPRLQPAKMESSGREDQRLLMFSAMAGARSARPNVGDTAAMEVAHKTGSVQPLQLSTLFDQLTVECRFVLGVGACLARVQVWAERHLSSHVPQMCVRACVTSMTLLNVVYICSTLLL